MTWTLIKRLNVEEISMWWLTFSQHNSTGLETKPMKNCQTNSTCDVNSKTHASTVRWYLVLTQHQDIGSWGGTVMNMSGWSLSTEAYPVTKQKLPQRKVLISMWAASIHGAMWRQAEQQKPEHVCTFKHIWTAATENGFHFKCCKSISSDTGQCFFTVFTVAFSVGSFGTC